MKKILLLIATMAIGSVSAKPSVVSTIYPLQQIANAIVGQPTDLINESHLSPHSYHVKPADIQKITDSDIVLWVGPALMPQLDKYIDKRADEKITLTATELPNIQLLESNHKHHEHHDNEHHHEYHNNKGDNEHTHEMNIDPHLWLSTDNAVVIAKSLTDSLIKLDKANTDSYQKNLQQFLTDVEKTKAKIIADFSHNPTPNYFVFHNAYAYFEKEFAVSYRGVITLYAGQIPKAKHLYQLSKQLKQMQKTCLFREPQFDSKIIKRLTDGTSVKIATLDPIGYEKDKNIGYPMILENIAKQIIGCGK
ncbi:MAG: zinc ABC transporter substrate-binding protein [Gammaproteobacteria bacterium]|nr:zinc ABC transporter substrate-binding protein [Gammaproteobacteria bacterium]